MGVLWFEVSPFLCEVSSCRHQSNTRLEGPYVELLLLVVDACRVEAAESLVSVSPVPLGILDTMYLEPFGTGCLTTSFPFLVSARNRLYQ